MGTTSALARKPVRMSAWTERPGLMSAGGSWIWTLTRNLMAFDCAPGGGQDRAAADLGDDALEGLVRIGVDADLGLLAHLHRRDRGLVHLQLGLDHRHVGDREEHGAGAVLDADHRHLALLDPLGGDDAVHGGADGRLGQGVARAFEGGARLLHPAGGRLGRGLGGGDGGAGALDLRLGDDAGREVLLRPAQVGAGLGQVRAARTARPGAAPASRTRCCGRPRGD